MTDWSDVINRHGPVVWKTAYRLLSNQADAADCFQDTFVEAVRLSRRQRIEHWPAVLRRIATTRALDRLRQRLRHSARHDTHNDGHAVASANPGPSEQAEAAELTARLRRAISALPTRQAEVFCLRCLDELSYEQIAASLGLTTNAVGVLLHKARGRLRQLLATNPPGED